MLNKATNFMYVATIHLNSLIIRRKPKHRNPNRRRKNEETETKKIKSKKSKR